MRDQKRKNLPTTDLPANPGLWVVATPIGNLGDLSFRAQKALKMASIIYCEDTRRTGQLLQSQGIHTKMFRLDAHATPRQIDLAVEKILEGQNAALVTDAGTPGISDPGAKLVEQARKSGVVVSSIAGPCALTSALSLGGFDDLSFTFRGFFPRKNSEKIDELQRMKSSDVSSLFVWYESPERIEDTLKVIEDHFGETEVLVCKELTKAFEKSWKAKGSEILKTIRTEFGAEELRGEWVLVVKFLSDPRRDDDESEVWVKTLQCLINAGISASRAALEVSQVFGAPKNSVKKLAIEQKKIRGD